MYSTFVKFIENKDQLNLLYEVDIVVSNGRKSTERRKCNDKHKNKYYMTTK